MKSQTLACITAVTLFAALAIPVGLAAQEQGDEPQHKKEHHRYKFVDIGTFGGPASYINNASALGAPNQINNRGMVVGAASTDIPAPPNKQICGGIDGSVPLIFHAFEWQNGELTDVGTLGDPAAECSQAVSINSRGEIAGISGNGVIDPLVGVEEIRAVLWKDGEIKDLGTLGGNHSTAIGINNRGEVAGFSVNTTPDPFSLLYFGGGQFTNGTQTRAFLWHKGYMRDLGTLGGPDAQGFGLNEHGQAVGISYINSIPNPITGLPPADPFLWTEDRGMIDLGTLGGAWGAAGALNNRGQVIGNSSLVADPGACRGIGDTANCHSFFWDDGKLTDLFTDTIGGSPVTANAINDAGEVVGAAFFPNQQFAHAYLWKNGVATDLGTLPGDCFSEAGAINARGQVVGQSLSCDFSTSGKGSVFLWENGSMIDLNAFVPPGSGVQLAEGLAINDRGEIGGLDLPPSCTGDAQCGHAYVLIPCDEDASASDGCQEADAASQSVEEVRAAPPVPAQTTATQPNLTPTEMRDRVRSLLFNRNRRFRTLQPK